MATTLVVLDDPQTDESARSPSQCAKREEILAGAVLGLAGPGVKISGFMPCTVICPGDMADAILDRDRHPEWNWERTKLVYSFPTNEKHWQRYAEIRAESLRQGHEGEEATAYYRDNQVEMDAGAIVAWPERFNHDEISAIQHAMNLRLRNESAFFAEYQNEPRVLIQSIGRRELHADAMVSRLTHVPLGQVPRECTRLTAFIDCGNLLWWSVCGWTESFSGTVIDYGTWPPQSRSYFTKADAKPTIQDRFPGLSEDAALYAALQALMSEIVGMARRKSSATLVS